MERADVTMSGDRKGGSFVLIALREDILFRLCESSIKSMWRFNLSWSVLLLGKMTVCEVESVD